MGPGPIMNSLHTAHSMMSFQVFIREEPWALSSSTHRRRKEDAEWEATMMSKTVAPGGSTSNESLNSQLDHIGFCIWFCVTLANELQVYPLAKLAFLSPPWAHQDTWSKSFCTKISLLNNRATHSNSGFVPAANSLRTL